jgi:diguanylate cyclase (GGDEF)-like protein
MNDPPDQTGNAAGSAKGELGHVNGQVEAMRAVLAQLLQDVVRADSHLDHSQAARLREANEHLVVSALGALTDAETAHGALDEASRAGALDPLTGLPNRTLLLDRFENAICNAKRHGNRVGLLFLDLNDFKQINDSFGHATGDRALQLVADCLSSLVRETDAVSRHGGDEFLILLAEMVRPADAALVAEKVNAALGAYGRIDDHVVSLKASIGISVYPEDGEDARTLIDRADAAMYLAKKQTLGGFVFHAAQPPGQTSVPAPAIQSQRRRLTHHELTLAEHEQRHQQLREANEELVLAVLGAQELLATAEQTCCRQAELLAMAKSRCQ